MRTLLKRGRPEMTDIDVIRNRRQLNARHSRHQPLDVLIPVCYVLGKSACNGAFNLGQRLACELRG
jgi:hypothetical protein